MTEYVSRYLGVSLEEAQRLRESKAIPFGTTLKWLTKSCGMSDPEDFLAAVHPEDLTPYFSPNPQLRVMLSGLSLPRSILTNSNQEHTIRVLRRLGIEDQFQRIFDIRYNAFLGKPNKETYIKVIDELGFAAPEVLFIDDMPKYLSPFRELGGEVLLIDENAVHAEAGLPSLRVITELAAWLKNSAEGGL